MRLEQKFETDERSSYNFKLTAVDYFEAENIAISSVKASIYVEGSGDPPEYVNGRDGSHGTGLSFIDNGDGSWTILFHLLPADNAIVDKANYAKPGYEKHIVRFEIKYNSDADTYYLECELRVRELVGVA